MMNVITAKAYPDTSKHFQSTSREEFHRTYGGLITIYDFEGYTSPVSVDNNIRKDMSFDITCYRDALARERQKKEGLL